MALRTLGDVLSRSSTCVSLSDNATIRTLAAALVKNHVDAVSILSASDGHLCGIATARDVTKCIARNLDLDATTVSNVMTPNPITLPPTETPANALSLMRQGRFRHIPVIAPDKSVIGIVDVLSLAYDAITRLQLSYSMIPSRRGYDLLRAARETMEKPTLRPIVERNELVTLSTTSSVTEACELIVTKHVAAIVVVDANGVIDGIFTCTDIVKRVVITRKDPSSITVGDVMTVNPDCASPDFTILECLQRMQACGFRHLPVVDDRSRVVIGLVDVLQLASDTLLDLNSAASNKRATAQAQSTPSSSRALQQQANQGRVGLGRGLANLFGSLFSSNYAQRDNSSTNTQTLSHAPYQHPASQSGSFSRLALQSQSQPQPQSLSQSQSSAQAQAHAHGIEPATPTRKHYGYLPPTNKGRIRHARSDVPLASFKFRDVNGDFRRIKVPMVLEHGDYDKFVLDVRRRYSASSSMVGAVRITYIDEDGDDILIANDDELASCFHDLSRDHNRTIMLRVEEEQPTSSKLQSPISSTPSSVLGSPGRQSVSSDRQIESPSHQPTVEPPPLEDPTALRDLHRQSGGGVYRTSSRLKIHTPSSKKASEGHQMMLDKRIDEAIILFTEALQLDEENARALGERGAAHLLNGDPTEAESDYRGAMDMLEKGKGGRPGDMTHQMCIVGLVETLIDQHRYEEAANIAAEMKPEWGNSGCGDAFRDELDNACNAAQKAVEAGNYADAMNCFSNAIRVENAYLKVIGGGEGMGRVSLRLGRAKCYMDLEDYEMALEDFVSAAKLDGESLAAHKGRGKSLMELNQLPQALGAYETAQGLDPTDNEVNQAIKTIKSLLPDPLQLKKEKIAKLGAMLGNMDFNMPTTKKG